MAPSENEVQRFVASVGQTCDLQAFVKFCDSIVHPEDTFENLVQFFRSYDSNVSSIYFVLLLHFLFLILFLIHQFLPILQNSGSITSQQLTSLLTNTGEVLTSKEIEILLK